MSWRERIRGSAASFRGTEFFVDVAEREGGRRTVRHEYPLRDGAFREDLGRRPRAFSVEAYVCGDAYLLRKDSLIAVLEEEGPGELVHPYYGSLWVACTSFRVRESSGEGGIARFAIEFEESSTKPPFPTVSAAAAGALATDATAVQAAMGAQLTREYSISGLSSTALANLGAIIRSGSEAMREALSPVVQETQQLARLKHDLDAVYLDADALVREPFKVLGAYFGALAALESPPLTPRLGLSALLTAYGFVPDAPRPPATTASRQREQAMYDLILWIVRSSLIVSAAKVAPEAGFDTYDGAVAARDAIAEGIDEQTAVASDDAYGALMQLRADLVRAVPGEDSDLPRLIAYTPGNTIPSLVLAYRLYGNLDREADLVARNRVLRPGYILGGRPLEVLSA